ncbi:hypothetical protein [Kitasatospora acidiphila]|nr:hypothetical protein [Kitasatospora acidiphila]
MTSSMIGSTASTRQPGSSAQSGSTPQPGGAARADSTPQPPQYRYE